MGEKDREVDTHRAEERERDVGTAGRMRGKAVDGGMFTATEWC